MVGSENEHGIALQFVAEVCGLMTEYEEVDIPYFGELVGPPLFYTSAPDHEVAVAKWRCEIVVGGYA